MAYRTKFEAVRTQAIESGHTSLSSDNGTEHKVDVEPQTLPWWQAGRLVGALIDVLAISLSCTFFVYAVAVKTHESLPMENPRVRLLLKLSNLGPTVYPILFAAIIGRALKSIAFWKLEKGGKIGTLDRLLGSMTIVQTVFTQIQMRTVSLLGLLLIVIWSLSPLGSQASLRIIGSTTNPSNTTQLVQYVDVSSDILSDEYAGADTASQFVPVDVLFGAAMLGASSGSSSSSDAWGNLKVPWIESLEASAPDAEGWYSVPQLNSSDNFTSLIGVPFSMISHASNLVTSFNIETSYWTLACPILENLSDGSLPNGTFDQFLDPDETSVENPEALDAYNLYLYSVDTRNDSQASTSPINSRLRHITYLENNNADAVWIGANCTIKTKYVEVSASCSKGSCTAVKIRNSRQTHAPENFTSFDFATPGFYWFAQHFANALAAGHSATASPYQKFIIDPLNPLNQSYNIPPVTVVSKATFALRLGQLFNTYWMAMLAPTAIPKGLRNANITADTAPIGGTILSNTTATLTQYTLVLECNALWFVILLLSSAITALIGFCGLIASLCRLGPDVGFNISSLVKDSPFVDQTNIATTLGSTDRSILMRKRYAKLGDIAAEDEVGYIAIGSGNVADLQRGRFYR